MTFSQLDGNKSRLSKDFEIFFTSCNRAKLKRNKVQESQRESASERMSKRALELKGKKQENNKYRDKSRFQQGDTEREFWRKRKREREKERERERKMKRKSLRVRERDR